ncbi:hypothetical protein M3484_16030 [Pseudomonas sp. GX19020]|uniref:hypothetical protein n=1 Tax=Pseudomonas sp. GX19020 TaxID=2942277 RepID=UPI0020192A11|nr:hypothetical protein [Pseudomonas sp. GX19020]MCL4068081.1 hypothetical protein [Pseudomonas sp. GX19020]
MPGKSLSPWTLSWFGSAIIALLLALVLALAAGIGPEDFDRPEALAIVHLFALGWLVQVMLGALVQFVPVLAARPLAFSRLALPALLASSLGTLALAGGFLSLDGYEIARPLFLLGPVALGLSFAMLAVMILATLVTRQTLRLPEVRMVLVALAGLAGLWLSGAAMVSTLAGSRLAVDLSQALPLHMLFGIGGFLSFAAIGVSYKLFAMFLLAPEAASWQRRAVFALAALMAGLMLTGLLMLLLDGSLTPLLIGVCGISLAGCGIYLDDVRRLWRARRRPTPELNMSWSRMALGFLALSVLLLPLAVWQGGALARATVFAALVGWLSTLTLAQMIRITAFLTWIQVFAPLIGRRKVPTVQSLTHPRRAGLALTIWSLAAGTGTLSLATGFHAGFRLALCGLLIAATQILCELVAIRSLSHLPAPERPGLLPPLVLPAFLKSPPSAENQI